MLQLTFYIPIFTPELFIIYTMISKRALIQWPLLLVIFAFTSCIENFDNISFPEGEVQGYKPIYIQEEDLSIALEESRGVLDAGRIYLYGDLLLLNERYKGIHLIDNADPRNPQNIGFLRIMGATDMAIRNRVLYVNQFEDLLAIDVSDINNIQLITREEKVLAIDGGNQVPPLSGYYFECVDPTKGVVTGWELTTITGAKCYY
ncbi:MAG: hypothetical protein ACI905_002495 [Roseivirga sp.]|jgi:hypothetical protein